MTLFRKAIVAGVVAGLFSTPAPSTESAPSDAIRPFRINVSDAALRDLRQRLRATRWPDQETVADASQGIQRAKLQALVRYWADSYDWRRVEATLNALPQFVTTIDGVDIHFIHVRSRHPNALPVIVTHGWPGSVIEQLKIIGPLTDPRRYGGQAADAFDVVIPSLPGYGFSGRPAGTGWGPERIARAWAGLMKRLGYTDYVAQGGDWGTPVSSEMARLALPGLRGIHINLPATVPNDVALALVTGALPAGLTEKERAVVDVLKTAAKRGSSAYATMLAARPQTVGYGVTDSPVGLAAWTLGHPGFATWDFGVNPRQTLTRDDVLDNITVYWLTNTATSAGRLYWENAGRSAVVASAWKTTEITLPVAITVFGEDAYLPPETWARRAYPSLSYFREVENGGHFAAWEQPQLFVEELRAAFRSLRVTQAVTRTDLMRHDLGVAGREVIQVLVEFAPAAVAPRHSHPGEEVAFVVRGALEYQLDGRPAVTLDAGGTLFIPAGVVHTARNVGPAVSAELATYIVDRGKPLVVAAK